MPYDEEEFQSFVRENRELIERMMALQKDAAVTVASAGRDMTHEAVGYAREAADRSRERADEFMRATYGMFMDPEVQRHFMTMGMEFVLGVTTMLSKAPTPDFMKDAAETTARTWKQTTCRVNDECAAKRRPEKVELDDEPEAPAEPEAKPKGPVSIPLDDGE